MSTGYEQRQYDRQYKPRQSRTGKLAALITGLVLVLGQGTAQAEGPFRNTDNKNMADIGEGTYPVPYKSLSSAEIAASLHRIRGYLDSVTPTRVVNRKTGEAITDFSKPVPEAAFEQVSTEFGIMIYEMGLVHSALIKAREATGDQRFTDMTARHLQFYADVKPYFEAQEKAFKLERGNSFSRFLDPRSLDDVGSMCAALIRSRFAKIGPDHSAMIATCSDWVANKQFRLADGTLARKRPQAVSLWGDDLYMGVPALAEIGHLTGKRVHFDDAVKNVLQMSAYLFNKNNELYTHGLHINNPDAPRFYWARANGWAVLAMSDLLDVLPKDHPGYKKVVAQLRTSLHGIAEQQSGNGLWHNMIDRHDSFLETSASAMFVYAIAHAINEGWISPTTYGSVAHAGWVGLSTKINDKGQVEGTVVGTTLASDHTYYYNRPTSVHAMHGYGPTLLAGAEMIKLLNNPKVAVEYKVRTYHYLPKGGTATDYREHH